LIKTRFRCRNNYHRKCGFSRDESWRQTANRKLRNELFITLLVMW